MRLTGLCLKASRAMSRGFAVTVVLRTRPEQKVRGHITHRELIEGYSSWGSDRNSNVTIRIDGGERIPIVRIADIRRQRAAA